MLCKVSCVHLHLWKFLYLSFSDEVEVNLPSSFRRLHEAYESTYAKNLSGSLWRPKPTPG